MELDEFINTQQPAVENSELIIFDAKCQIAITYGYFDGKGDAYGGGDYTGGGIGAGDCSFVGTSEGPAEYGSGTSSGRCTINDTGNCIGIGENIC